MMKTKLSFFLILISTSYYLNAQMVFMKSFGGVGEDAAYCAALTAGGGIVTVGYEAGMDNVSQFFGKKIYMNWFDHNGNHTAARALGWSLEEKGYHILRTSDNHFLISGVGHLCIGANCGTDGYLLKTDAQGSQVWAKGIGGLVWDELLASVELPGGDYIILGKTNSYGSGNYDAFLLRMRANGDTVWSSTFGSQVTSPMYAYDQCREIIYYGSALYLSGSIYRESDNKFYPWVFKTDLSGNLKWSRMLNTGTAPGDAFDITEIGGNLVFFTNTRIVKIDTAGNLISIGAMPQGFSGQYGNPYHGGITTTADGNILVCGHFQAKACVMKFNSSLQLQWIRTFPDAAVDASFATSVTEMPDGRLLISGLTYKDNVNDSRLWVTRPDGTLGACSEMPAYTLGLATGAFEPVLTIAMRTGLMVNPNGQAASWTIPSSEYTINGTCEAGYDAGISGNASAASAVHIFPNPAADAIHIRVDADFAGSAFAIYNPAGTAVLTGFIAGESNTVDIGNLPAGIYMFSLDGRVNAAKRFVKE
jgi:hypothetical protein